MESTQVPAARPVSSDSKSADWVAASNFKLLKIYSYYRTLLSSLLLLMFTGGLGTDILGTSSPNLFLYTSSVYTIINTLTLLLLWYRPHSFGPNQVSVLLVFDVVAIVFLTHSSDGVSGSLGYLLLICIAAASMFLQSNRVLALAGFAALLVLTESFYSFSFKDAPSRSVFSAGVFGILLFTTAVAFSILSEKIRSSNLEALLQAEHAAYLQKLAQMILERMRTGIIVVNSANEVVLINRAALVLLGITKATRADLSIETIDPLYEHLKIWRSYPHTRSPHLKTQSDGPELRVSFAKLDATASSDTLIFIEDNRLLSQEAQQLKLASLGRLTASIAHEVRNPLGAISHAAQLLSESTDIAASDKRLSDIIQSHSRRVNHIIENVLQLSRRKAAAPELLDLSEWLSTFINEYRQGNQSEIELKIFHKPARTRVDPSQLQQVLTNLCDNGLRYSEERTGRKTLCLQVGVDLDTELPYIEVVDEGPGIDDADVQQIFEPFFTTESTGSGLGLYISRELCEGNQATLDYKRTEAGKSCFRINFAHPERIF